MFLGDPKENASSSSASISASVIKTESALSNNRLIVSIPWIKERKLRKLDASHLQGIQTTLRFLGTLQN